MGLIQKLENLVENGSLAVRDLDTIEAWRNAGAVKKRWWAFVSGAVLSSIIWIMLMVIIC